jgi:hypothetical protein
MSIEITTAFVNHYRANVIHLAQQKGSKLRNSVRVQTDVIGKSDHFDRIGVTAARKVNTRHRDSPLMNTPHSRRRVSMDPYDWGDLIDREDQQRLLISPASEYAIAGANALGRSIDDVIIAAALGLAYSVDELDAATSVALPASQIIANGGTGFTLAKWRLGKRTMDEANVEEEDRHLWGSPTALDNLLATTAVTSADFNTVKALVDGTLNTFLGFQVHISTRLPKTGNIRSAILMQRQGVGLSIGRDIEIRMQERADKAFALYVFECMDVGATRIEEARVVQIDHDETA